MAQQRGSNAKMLMGFENAAYGTVAVDGFDLPFNSIDVRPQRNLNQAATLTGTKNPVEPFAGNQDVTGTLVVPVDSEAFIYWLIAMFGDPTTTGAGPYVHEFKIGADQPSFSIEKQFPDLAATRYERLVGCKVASMTIEVGGDGELVASMEVRGAKGTVETTSFDGTPTAVTLARVQNFQASIDEGGAGLSNAQQCNLTVDFGLDDTGFVIGGGGVRGGMPEGIVGVSGMLTTLFEDDSLLQKAVALTESSLLVTITGAANSIVEYEVQELYYALNGVPIPGPQGLVADLDFQGFFANGTETSAVVFRVTNDTVSYDLIT